jgi:S1-C subfamily serine protease
MNAELNVLSNALADAVEAAGASVVHVDGRRRRGSSGVVWSDGVVVTADHTVERDEDLAVRLPDGSRVAATLAGRDPGSDLAVLRAETPSLAAPSWAEPGSVRVGHLALCVSRPGRGLRAELGVVAALGEGWRTPAGGRIDQWLATDIPIRWGFSGSLLLDAGGRALGINSAGLLRGESLTVPAPTVRRVVESLLAHGRVRRGYLGIAAQPVRLPGAVAERAGQPTGLLVMAVEAGSPAEAAGLVLGDVLLALDGQPAGDFGELLAQLSEERVGSEATLKILRAGEVVERRVEIGAR